MSDRVSESAIPDRPRNGWELYKDDLSSGKMADLGNPSQC